MRRALVVGIDSYIYAPTLHGCVNDAYAVSQVLQTHFDGSPNFDVRLEVATSTGTTISRQDLKEAVVELYSDDPEVALFYFSGHGALESTGGYLCSSEVRTGDDGFPLRDLLLLAQRSRARNKVIILDCCHSGALGEVDKDVSISEIGDGMTILSASTATQYASEENGSGVFTDLLVDALLGSAGNITGRITPGSVYAHIDQSLGAWAQRPVFKTNVKSFISLRNTNPSVPLDELRMISVLFPQRGYEFPLNPSYEPRDEGRTADMPSANAENCRLFAILQRLNRVNLVAPVDATHMWNAAMESKGCKLTALGEHYRRLSKEGKIQ